MFIYRSPCVSSLKTITIKFLFLIISLFSSNICAAQNVEGLLNRYKDKGLINPIFYEPTTLNPIFSQDSVSSAVIGEIFDGLVNLDERGLPTKGCLAETWEIYEEVYLIPNKSKILPNGKSSNAKNVVNYLRSIIEKNTKLKKKQDQSISNIKRINIINAEKLELTIDGYYINKSTKKREYLRGNINIKYPERVKITLKKVDELFEDTIKKLFGKDYFKDLDMSSYVELEKVNNDYKDSVINQYLKAYEENPTIIFNLKKGVKFHDGHEFDAYDVKFTYESIVNPRNNSPRLYDFEPIKKIDIIDKHTVRIVYYEPFSLLFRAWGIGILPEHLLNDKALYCEALKNGIDPNKFSMNESRFWKSPIGTGPFKFVKWIPKRAVILEKNSDFFYDGPSLDYIVYLILPSSDKALALYKKGISDSYDIPCNEVDRFKENNYQYIFSGYSYSTTYIAYNTKKSLFQDKLIRKALAMAINYDEIITKLNFGHAVRTTGLYPIKSPYYNRNIKHIQYDPQMAKKILANKGWKDRDGDGTLDKQKKPFSFTILTNNNAYRIKIVQCCKKYWRNIGIDVSIKIVKWKDFIKQIFYGDFDATLAGWSLGIDPDLFPIFHSSQIGPNQLNNARYKNEKADKLMELIRRTYDQKRQIEYAHQLQKIIYEDQPYTFLYVGKWHVALSKRIVMIDKDDKGNITYTPVRQARSGSITYYFNKWVKLPKERGFR